MFNKIYVICFFRRENVNFTTTHNNNDVDDIMNTIKDYVE